MRISLVAAACGLLASGASAQHDHGADAGRPAAHAWTRLPLLLPAAAGGEREGAVLRPVGIEAAELYVFAADGPVERRRVAYPVARDGARIEAAAAKLGNYHWVLARQESAHEVRIASTVWYFSNPGAAPTALLRESRHELEIAPERLPREHGAYRESEKWRFLVRWQGQPLANQPLTLETELGSRSRFVTDATGVATVLFPRDMAPDEGAAVGRGPRRAKFVLATERQDDATGKHYLSAFNYTYGADADRQRSLPWGAAFGLLGMGVAVPLLRSASARRHRETAHG